MPDKNFRFPVEIGAGKKGTDKGNRALEIDARLKDELFLRVFFERHLGIHPRNVDKSMEGSPLPIGEFEKGFSRKSVR